MRTLIFLGNVLDLVVIGTIRIIFSWAIIPIAIGALLVYSRYSQ